MINIPEDYAISRKEVWRILTAGVMLSTKQEDWKTAGAILAMKNLILELPEKGVGTTADP